jgi:hypothetical protein
MWSMVRSGWRGGWRLTVRWRRVLVVVCLPVWAWLPAGLAWARVASRYWTDSFGPRDGGD